MTHDVERDPSAEEAYVANVYRALGYRVRRDLLVNGTQIDVEAVREIPGYGSIKLMIEVKRYERSVPKQVVAEFLATSRTLLAGRPYSKAVMVSGSGFTRNARAMVEPFDDIELLDIRELEESFLAVEEPLLRYVTSYRDKPIHTRYVDLRASLLSTHPHKAPAPSHTSASSLAEVAVDQRRAVLISADYGQGKSTTLERIKATAAERYLSNRASLIPVLFLLKEFGEAVDVDTYVQESFRREFGLSITADLFMRLVEGGRFLILLDGFDEITLRADATRRAELVRRLSPLIFGGSPSILTTRPSYFASASEYGDALRSVRTARELKYGVNADRSRNTQVQIFAESLRRRYQPADVARAREADYASYRLELLSTDQIDTFLQHNEADFARVGTNALEVRRFLDTVYDLSDLIRRPIILDMAVATVISGSINVSSEIVAFGPANLYEAYTGSSLEIDHDKGQSRRVLLSPTERRDFAQRCAEYMLEHDVLEVDETVVAQLALKVASPNAATLDEVLTDLRTCSFLTVSDSGALRFIHRSFQEFFVAREVKDQLIRGHVGLLRGSLPHEVLYFLGAFAFSDGELLRIFHERVRTPGTDKAQVRSNLAAATFLSRDVVADLEWNDLSVAPVVRSRARIERSRLSKVRLQSYSGGLLQIRDSAIDLVIASGDLARLEIDSCTGSASVPTAAHDIALTDCEGFVLEAGTYAQVLGGSGELTLSGEVSTASCTDCRIVISGHQAELDVVRSDVRLRSLSPKSRWTGSIRRSKVVFEGPVAFAASRLNVVESIIMVQRPASSAKDSGLAAATRAARIERSLVAAPADVNVFTGGIDGDSSMVLGGRLLDRKATGWRGIMFGPSVRSKRRRSRSLAVVTQSADQLLLGVDDAEKFEAFERRFDALVSALFARQPGPLSNGISKICELIRDESGAGECVVSLETAFQQLASTVGPMT